MGLDGRMPGTLGTREDRDRCGRARPRLRAIQKLPERFRDRQSKADK